VVRGAGFEPVKSPCVVFPVSDVCGDSLPFIARRIANDSICFQVLSGNQWHLWAKKLVQFSCKNPACANSVQIRCRPEICAKVVQTFWGGIHAERLTQHPQQTLRVNRMHRRKIGFIEGQRCASSRLFHPVALRLPPVTMLAAPEETAIKASHGSIMLLFLCPNWCKFVAQNVGKLCAVRSKTQRMPYS
jgi:hypothetical protein